MESGFINLIRNARKNKLGKVRNKINIFLVCLGIAIFLWALVRLSKDYYHNIDFTVRYVNIPENLVLVNQPDSIITLKVVVQGFDLFSSPFLSKENRFLDISLHRIRVKPYGNDIYRGMILTSSLGKEISSQFNITADIFSISPDTVFFFFEKKNPKKLNESKPVRTMNILDIEDSIRLYNDSVRNSELKKQSSSPLPRKHK
ncbi:MAG: hypothetical protein Q8867_02055 [Bacteroidota bacterium]|nr:hypothetical protein [Bacteroidota bacterium]